MTRKVTTIRFSGHEMEPEIMPGDTLYIEDNKHVKPGDIVITTTDDEPLVIGRYFKVNRKDVLFPSNPAYGPCVLKNGEIERIIGKVIGLARSLRTEDKQHEPN